LSLFRIFGGTAIGAASVVAPANIAEVSPASYRGRLGSLPQLAIVSGIFVALLCDYALAEAEKPLWFGLQAWRSVMAGLSLVFVLAKIKETRGFELEEMT